ncbi:hypothetical protein [Dactylosporangium sp. CS-033363]|uniref:hypothetical protein n=1 Tax=Dactylosporangium sp. CS-033363 TaxID=3239935 RepID=UPI003D8B55B3
MRTEYEPHHIDTRPVGRCRDFRGNWHLVLVAPQRVVGDGECGVLTRRPNGMPWL